MAQPVNAPLRPALPPPLTTCGGQNLRAKKERSGTQPDALIAETPRTLLDFMSMEPRSMICRKTVFILGAGSSLSYGFPLGRGLVFAIDWTISTPNPGANTLLKILRQHDLSELTTFKEQLRTSNLSIDAYLESHPEHLEMGKAAIATVLIPLENPGRLQRSAGGLEWYEYLFQQMGMKRDRFEESAKNLSIITFNYDRSLDYFLYRSAVAAFGETFAINVMKEIPIIHVYGQLGKPIFFTKCDQDPTGGFRRDYTPDLIEAIVSTCVYEIKIMPERSDDSREFILARDLLSKADVLCFLGFGYDPTNFHRLQVSEHFRGGAIYCSIVGLAHDEVRRASMLFGSWRQQSAGRDVQIGTMHSSALEFLQWYPIFD